MSIVSLDKVTVYGMSRQKMSVLDGLQQLGCLHLVNLHGGRIGEAALISKDAREALRYLETCPHPRRETSSRSHYDQAALVDELLTIKQTIARRRIERDELKAAIVTLEPWGEFAFPPDATSFPDATSMSDQFWFYVVPLPRVKELPGDLNWYVAKEDSQSAYVVVLSSDQPEGIPYPAVELDRRPLSELRGRLEAIEEEIDELRWRRVTLSSQRGLLKDDLDAADDRAAQSAANNGVYDTGEAFALQGWVPRDSAAELREFASRHGLAVTIEPATSDDSPPTLLANPERLAGAEGCVTFYITPNYHAWDPTSVVYFSFSLFFAMIVSDAGYGLVMAGLLMFSWRSLGRSRNGARLRNLFVGIVSATICYGIVVGSYFGIEPGPGSFLDTCRVRIDGQPMMSNQTAMMAIAVAIGVAHLSLANVISAWQARRTFRSLGHLGWSGLMLGVFLAGAGAMKEHLQLEDIGTKIAIVGACCVLLFSSDRPLATINPLTHLFRLGEGVMQFTQISKAFGDSLSYLRLFALGLASAQLAVTFNGLASDAFHAGGMGVLLALVIIVVGHGINFLLALMGGVVHGLRLNCIEFFNWSLSEEGYPFEPFRKKAEV